MKEYNTNSEDVGLTTQEGLTLLRDEVEREVTKYKQMFMLERSRTFLSTFHPSNVTSPFHYTSMLQLVVFVFCLFTAFICLQDHHYHRDTWWIIEAMVLIFLVVVNTFLIGYINVQKKEELFRLTQRVLSIITECAGNVQWSSNNYPHIYSPLSPSVSLQWTFRDGEVVNLPVCLLVPGDVILVRPGHSAPARCRLIQDDSARTTLEVGQLYVPESDSTYISQSFDHTLQSPRRSPQSRNALSPAQFVVEQTPFITTITCLLETNQEPPASVVDNERHIVGSVWVERRIFVVFMVIVLICNCLRFIYFGKTVGHWTQVILITPIHTLLPLVSAVFPIWWTLVRYFGHARLLAAFDVIRLRQKFSGGDGSFDFEHFSSMNINRLMFSTNARELWAYFRGVARGDLSFVTRRVDLCYTLGSVTSVCCVDKKGILSWPNPTAEKVFFLTTPTDTEVKKKDGTSGSKVQTSLESNFKVLDMTHDSKTSFSLQFDHSEWKEHLSSLKPIGLNILLNTCNMQTVEWYTQFTDHVACTATKNEETVAVVNRRCLCELACEMGFKQKAVDNFNLHRILGLYKQVPAEESAKERLHRARSAVEHKIPMPNMVGAVIRQSYMESHVMTQGTADIIMDCCTDYWDGSTLHPLIRADKKKILDFYRRTTMAAYCTAFSYMPVLQELSDEMGSMYIELPNHKHHSSFGSENDPKEGDRRRIRAMSHEAVMKEFSPQATATDSYKTWTNQIFIGMVTMQYQARQDTVHLIDQLDLACIRFVHFSEENELRSRVFSEKMGLEAGWNCHISLKPNRNYDVATTDAPAPRRVSNPDRKTATDAINVAKYSLNPSLLDEQKYVSSPELFTSGSCLLHSEQVFDSRNDEWANLLGTADGACVVEVSVTGSSDDNDDDDDHVSSFITLQTSDSHPDLLDNRANLPRGIENIRPHLNNVDNVPLLVNLFTDCTPAASTEMIAILQEHGEVVLCLGSSLNTHNTPMFLQADISVAVEPLHPQICAKYDVLVEPWDETMMTPGQLAGLLTTIPCSLSIRRKDNINFAQLIAQARDLVMASRSCFQLMLHFHLAVSLIQLLSSLLQFAPILCSTQVLWLLCFIIPALCLSVLRVKFDSRMFVWATGKNVDHIGRDTITQFSMYCLCRVIACIIAPISCFGYTSYTTCLHVSTNSTNCNMYVGISSGNGWNPWLKDNEASLTLAQNIVLFQLTLNFGVTSMSILHKYDQIWQKVPLTNITWLFIVTVTLVVQAMYCVINVAFSTAPPLTAVPPAVWVVTFLWPVCVIVVNELIKRKEIKQWVRYQKRCRLNFGTKLGMNSPF